jgi:hypothetical protein
MQDLLVRSASFAGWFFPSESNYATSTKGRIPKTFLIRDIPILAFSLALINLIFQGALFQRVEFGKCDREVNPDQPDSFCILQVARKSLLRWFLFVIVSFESMKPA